MKNNTFRLIAWSTMLIEYPKYFDSFLSNLPMKSKKSLWQSYLYKFFNQGYTDDEIIMSITKKNFNLLISDDIEDIISDYNKTINYVTDFYTKNKVNLLTSFDLYYPDSFKRILIENLSQTSHGSDELQYIPNVFVHHGDLALLKDNTKKLAIIGTRESKNFDVTRLEIQRIHKKYPDAVCVTGLASGIDSMGVLEFEKSICFLGEDLFAFIKRNQKDTSRLQAKEKTIRNGLIITHKLPHENIASFEFKNALLERNLFVVLLSDSVHPIEFGIKSGTISAINHAIKNNKRIYTPSSLVSDDVKSKYQKDIKFY